MRLDVKKILFIGIKEEREHFFQQAQKLGVIHFIEAEQKMKELSPEIEQITQAIKVLRGLPVVAQEDFEDFSFGDELSHTIIQLKRKIEGLQEEVRLTHVEIARVAIFGDFSQEDLKWIEQNGKRKIQFFFSKLGIKEEFDLPEEVLFVDSDHGLDYFVAISPEPIQHPKLIEMRIEHPVGELKQRNEQIHKELHQKEHLLKTYAKYNRYLHQYLIHKLNSHSFHAVNSAAQLTLDDSLFVITGWVPINQLEALANAAKSHNVYIEEIAIEPTDAIPTYLENTGLNRIGEDVINVYDTPSHTDRDPSLWVLISFALFFSFIVGDAGYGTIFLAAVLYIRYRHRNLFGWKQRLLNLATILSFSTIAWGVLSNSFFGLSFPPDSPVRKVSLVHWLVEKKTAYHIKHQDATYTYWISRYPALKEIQDPQTFMQQAFKIDEKENVTYELVDKFSDNILMELALLIGTIHIIISLLRYGNRNWKALGWILFIIGGYLYLPNYLEATSIINFTLDIPPSTFAENGLYLIYGGIGIAVIIALFKEKLLGILEIMTVIQIFADIMSYLRLYALGLAGAIVTMTINEAASSFGFVIGGLLILIGYTLNMGLAIMGGVIHGLRLNFIEWYHYSFEGGGKQFKPFKYH